MRRARPSQPKPEILLFLRPVAFRTGRTGKAAPAQLVGPVQKPRKARFFRAFCLSVPPDGRKDTLPFLLRKAAVRKDLRREAHAGLLMGRPVLILLPSAAVMKQGGGYIFASDHSIPNSVSLENMQSIINTVKEVGKY